VVAPDKEASQGESSRGVRELPVVPKGTIEVDDGRGRGEWESRYPPKVWWNIVIEAVYLVVALGACVTCLLCTWLGTFEAVFSIPDDKAVALNRYLFYFFGGVFGGALFGIKWLYHSVARGFWNADRRPWRYMVPLLSGGFALASSFILEAGLSRIPTSGQEAEYVAVGFLIGYFSDKAVSMLSRIADVIFGSPDKR
jgi:H+/Cl- antiporter ClcA